VRGRLVGRLPQHPRRTGLHATFAGVRIRSGAVLQSHAGRVEVAYALPRALACTRWILAGATEQRRYLALLLTSASTVRCQRRSVHGLCAYGTSVEQKQRKASVKLSPTLRTRPRICREFTRPRARRTLLARRLRQSASADSCLLGCGTCAARFHSGRLHIAPVRGHLLPPAQAGQLRWCMLEAMQV